MSPWRSDIRLPGDIAEVSRWTAARKAELLRRIRAGEITEAAACDRYDFTPEELAALRARSQRHGTMGLYSTKLQAVR